MKFDGQGLVRTLVYDLLLAVAATTTASILHWLIPGNKPEEIFLFYYFAVFVLAIVFRSAFGIVFTVILSILSIDFFFVEPWSLGSLGIAAGNASGFAFIGVFLSLLTYCRQWMDHDCATSENNNDRHLWELSHDLRSPLDAVTHAVEAIRVICTSSEISHEQRPKLILEMLESLKTSVFHQERLIESIMDGARFKKGKLRLQLSRVDIVKLVRNVESLFAGSIQAYGLNLSVETPLHPIFITGDVERLTRVLGNIISNAIKYTERGGAIHVTVSESDHVEIVVRDTGIGIAPDKLGKIFGVGYQVKPDQSGLGFGLAVANNIIREHQGKLSVVSRQGIGSEFMISLPKQTIAKKKAKV
jgi:K+-sensing histidine kinase KdpD